MVQSKTMTGFPLKQLLEQGHGEARGYGFAALAFVEDWCDFPWEEVAINSRLTTNIALARPFIPSPMGSVMDLGMAVRTALNGSIAIIPYTFSPEKQAWIVEQVRNIMVMPGVVPMPFTLSPGDKIQRGLETQYSYIPISDTGKNEGRHMGLYERKDDDFRYGSDPIATRMLTEHTSVDIQEVFKNGAIDLGTVESLLGRHHRPAMVITRHGSPWYLVTRASLEGRKVFSHATVRDGRLMCGAAVKKYDSEENRKTIALLAKAGADLLVVDTARGANLYALRTIEHIKHKHPGIDVMAGNFASRQGVRSILHRLSALKNVGVDGVRIGEGIGSICTTPTANGVWMPQVTAVYECADEARESGIPVCADGGLQTPFDILAVFAAGASSVMMGSRFAGTHESAADIVDGDWHYKWHIGMGSKEAWKKGPEARFHHGTPWREPLVEEGGKIKVKVTGHVDYLFALFEEGLKRSLQAIGIRSIEGLHKKFWDNEGPYAVLVDWSAMHLRGLHGGVSDRP